VENTKIVYTFNPATNLKSIHPNAYRHIIIFTFCIHLLYDDYQQNNDVNIIIQFKLGVTCLFL